MSNSKISALTSATTPLAGTEVLPVVQSSATTKVTVANLTAGRVVGTGGISNSGVFSSTASGTGASNRATFNASSEPFAVYLKYNSSTNGVYLGSSSADNFAAYTSAGSSLWSANSTTFNVPGNIVPNTAAQGINFTANTPAAGMTSQLLNWYEEGTFTPQLLGGTTNPTVTYTTQSGYYTRVGRLVTCQIYIQISGATGGSGTLLVNLPFTANAANQGSGSCAQYNVTYTGTQISAVVTSSAANLSFLGQTTNNSWSQLTTANLKAVATQAFSITVSYFV